jgi:hypothetical protein
MADQNIATRPRRSAAIEAQVKVEESYEIWGQPPSEDESKPATLGRKRSTTAEALTARKHRRTSIQVQDENAWHTVLPKTEAKNEVSTQPATRGRGQPRKNLVYQATLAEIPQRTKKITLSVPSSPAFKEALRRIWDAGDDARPPAESHTSGHAVVFDDALDERVTDFSAQGTTSETIAEAQSGPVPSKIFASNLSERRPSYNNRSGGTFRNVQAEVPDILHSGTEIHPSSPRAGANTANPSEEPMKFDPIDWELGGTPSKSENPRWESDHGRRLMLEQQQTAGTMREPEHPGATSFARTPPFRSEHTHPMQNPSSPSIKQPLNLATLTKHDLMMSTFMLGKQQKPGLDWEPSTGDKEAISKLAAHRDGEIAQEDITKMRDLLSKNISMHLRETPSQKEIDPLLHHFPSQAAIEYGRQKMATMPSKVATSSGLRDWTGVPNEYAVSTLPGVSTWPRATGEDLPTQVLHGRTASSVASSSEVRGAQVLHGDIATPILTYVAGKLGEAKDAEMQTPSPKPSEQRSDLERAVQQRHERGDDSSIVVHESIHTTTKIASKTCSTARGDQGFVLKRKPPSFHLPPMNLQTPSIYFDRNPQGSSIGAHSINPLVGLPDHSDPRTFYALESKDQAHVLASLKPTIAHFQQLAGGAEPLDVPLDSGYEVAHNLLQAHLRLWFVINWPDYAHKNAIPKLFKLERWEGGVEHWKYASNSPVSPIFLHNTTLRLTFQIRPMALTSLQDRVSTQHPFTPCLECTERNVFCSGFQKATESRFQRKCDACKAGGREYICSEPPIFVPVQQNYPPCDECTRDNVYCHGFEKDIRNRCEACLKGRKKCSYDMARFDEPVRI